MAVENFLATVEQNLATSLQQKAASLPKNFNQTKFLQNCLTVLESQDLSKCAPVSVVQTLMKGALLGLDFLNKECYAINYGGTLTFQTDYKGEKKLAMLYSIKPISEINTELVRVGDKFEKKYIDNKKVINFEPLPFNNGEIIGAFCVVLFQDGSIYSDDMSKEEIEDVRSKYSKCKDSPAWKNSPGEMYKKTIIKRTLKGVERAFESTEQLKAYEDCSDFEFNKQSAPTVSNPLASSFDNARQIEVKEEKAPPVPAEVVQEKPIEKPQPKQNDKKAEDTLDFMCSNCCVGISAKVKEFSTNKHGRPLCMDCQELAKAGQL